ncbi:coiled-coil domain-containing protein 63-like [Parasteatoda tepidariorum]|uniref:coiled-coil domain-containing protein 63-like n=1 Tax=Parasteatoda tepidariorum TaxID=114398 RepID=UPI0039BD766D
MAENDKNTTQITAFAGENPKVDLSAKEKETREKPTEGDKMNPSSKEVEMTSTQSTSQVGQEAINSMTASMDGIKLKKRLSGAQKKKLAREKKMAEGTWVEKPKPKQRGEKRQSQRMEQDVAPKAARKEGPEDVLKFVIKYSREPIIRDARDHRYPGCLNFPVFWICQKLLLIDVLSHPNYKEKSLHKYNQLLISNNNLREDINSLLLTQSSFRRKYSNIKRLLALGRKTLLEVVHSATMSYQTGESVKYKLNLVNERTQVDQKRLGEKIKELKILVEQDEQLKSFLEFKSRDGVANSEEKELETQNEQIMEQRLVSYHRIMARIQLASGCKDVNRICKTYLQEEESNLALFEKVNNMSIEIETLHEEVRAQREELDILSRQYKEQNRKDLAVRNDIENCTDKLRMEAQELEDASDLKAEELETIKSALKRIYNFLDNFSTHRVAFTVDEGITDDNVLQYLEALERRIIDVIRCHKLVTELPLLCPPSESDGRTKSEYSIQSRSFGNIHKDFSQKTTN